MYTFNHALDGVESSHDLEQSTAATRTAWGNEYTRISSAAKKIGTFQTVFTHNNPPLQPEEIIHEQDVHIVHEFVDDILVDVFNEINRREEWKHRKEIIEELYASCSELGVLGPTVWPPPAELEYKPKYELDPQLLLLNVPKVVSEAAVNVEDEKTLESETEHPEAIRKREAAALLTHGLATIVVCELLDQVLETFRLKELNSVSTVAAVATVDSTAVTTNQIIEATQDNPSETGTDNKSTLLSTEIENERLQIAQKYPINPVKEEHENNVDDVVSKPIEHPSSPLRSSESVVSTDSIPMKSVSVEVAAAASSEASVDSSNNNDNASPGSSIGSDSSAQLKKQKKFDLHERIMQHKSQNGSFNK